MHPRLKYNPHHEHYARMAMEFRPFVMSVHEPMFRSPCVNTDSLGFREQISAGGQRIGLVDLREFADSCDVILGGSTVFGVDATSDEMTISAQMTRLLPENDKDRKLVINLGIRGATSTQEAHIFQFARRFLPKIDNLIILSGVNNAYMSVVDESQRWTPFGALISDRHYYLRFREQYLNDSTNREVRMISDMEQWLLEQFAKPGRFRFLVEKAYKIFASDRIPQGSATQHDSKERLTLAYKDLKADLVTVRDLAPEASTRYVLQPAAIWCGKKLTSQEQKIIEADDAVEPVNELYGSQEFHKKFSKGVKELCAQCDMEFIDANDWFGALTDGTVSQFTDMCHLTDDGNRILAEKLSEHTRAGAPSESV